MRWLLLATVVPVAVLGCRNNAQLDAHLELMNAERRALEDELYELEYEHETALKKVEKLRQENAELRGQTDGSTDDYLDLVPGTSVEELPDLDLSPPSVEPGQPTGPDEPYESGLRNDVAGSEQVRRSVSLRQRLDISDVDEHEVTHLFINPELTHASDFDDTPGNDGITVVIEPRDDSGAFVPQAGRVSVVLLDYALRGQGARVARWDVDAKQVEALLVDTDQRQGIYLNLPWPKEPPEHDRLRLDVRYTTSDGRQLETRQDIHAFAISNESVPVSRPTQKSAVAKRRRGGWSPRAVNRDRGGDSPLTNAQHRTDPLAGPLTLEQAAGDAIRQDSAESDRRPKQQAARPTWRPYR